MFYVAHHTLHHTPNHYGTELHHTHHIQSLSDIAHSHVKLNRPCLEPCLRRLSKYIEGLGVRPCH